MNAILSHFSRQLIAGVVALLPVGGTILGIVWIEMSIADSWLAKQVYYFPGLGILLAIAALYLTGLLVSTFLGKWLWSLVDGVLRRVPLLGDLYRTLKQILGYGEGDDAVFERVVFVPSRDTEGEELGLVTGRLPREGGGEQLIVFVPGSPNPGTGRLVMLEESSVRPLEIKVNQALSALVSVGKSGLTSGA